MEIYKEVILDVVTGEETKIEFSPDELKAWKKQQAEAQATSKADADEIAKKQAARQSALEKLAALGLTEAEIQALAG